MFLACINSAFIVNLLNLSFNYIFPALTQPFIVRFVSDGSEETSTSGNRNDVDKANRGFRLSYNLINTC